MSSIGQGSISIDDSTRIGQNAQDTANEVAGTINDINSDNKLVPSEKLKLKQEYDKDVELYNIDIEQLKSVDLPTAELETAMSNLTAFVTPLFKEMNRTSTVDRDTLNGAYTAFATADKNASQAFVNMVQQVADDAKKAGDDAKETGEKAQEAGEEAKASANQAQADATQAKADAATAQQKAQSSIDQLNAHLPDIDEALSTANLVKRDVTRLSNTTEQYHNEYTTGIQNVIKTIDEASVGGTNLVPNSGMMQNTKGWNTTGRLITTKHAFYHNGQDPIFRLSNDKGSATVETTASNAVRFHVKRNTNYTMSVITFATSNTVDIDLYFLGRAYGSTNDFDKGGATVAKRKVSSNEAEYVTATFNTGDLDEGYFRIDNNGTTNGKQSDVYFTEVKVEEGTKATPWSPATTDLATETELDQTNEALKLTAKQSDMTEALNSITTLTETADGLQTQVNSKAGQSQVTQLADQYQAVVGSLTGSSLIQNSGYPIDTKHWTIGGGAKSTFSITTHAFYHNAKNNVFMLRNQGAQPTLECYASSERFPVKPNTQYSLSFKGFASSNVPSMDVFFLGRRYSSTSSTGYDKAILIVDKKVLSPSHVDTVQAVFNTGDCEEGYLRFDNNGSTDGKDSDLFFTEIQVNPGTIAMPWSAPTLSQADITASIGNIHLGVKNADGSTSTFNMNGNTILMDTAQTIINGNTSIQDGTISTAKIANAAINTAQIADGAINSAKIANASIDDAKINSLNGNKLIENSITANKINVDDLIANGINTKTLTSVNLNTSTLTTPQLDLGLNGTFTEDFDYTQSTSIFLPKKNTGTLTFNHGVLQSKGNMQTYVNGSWGGMNDNYTFQAGLDNSQWTEVAPGYIKLDLFKQNDTDVAERTYVDPTGFYYTTNSNRAFTSYVGNIVSTPQVQTAGVVAKTIDPLGDTKRLEFDHSGSKIGLQVGSYDGKEAVLSDYIYDFTASVSSNVYITSNGHLARSTSASKYKYNISNPEYEDVLGDRLLNVHLASWNDKNAIDSYAHTLNTGEDTEKISIDKYHGLIAEQLRDAGLEMFVEYNEDGEIEGIQYDRAWIPLLAVVRRLNNKINEYEMRISKLEEKNE
ncbi:hypothetical protein [Pediococcus acidilactici]|uniref:hypothetical protein n=3 Tax=Pediococcus acidilactici TaxID=1254 RepID=UPI001329BD88|nr:hypothetical protein [Pediococcus acidilactici]KAF0339781.1 hypothetical protein GBO40_04395 [Pediococcus acidilactici]KAF0379744.1 hypothetical protein GBO63_04380 [Pediococcus acidilactici]KAF0452984.1 hypothetical protein GBO98_04440 [Pediococcus acidilactici]KAF0462263.1 hypothetical protein GBP00_02615 [Pediococcus acidilactici]KAF0485481.1 hypothetical protein GBP14_06200 [Pediococcus acidilactici]